MGIHGIRFVSRLRRSRASLKVGGTCRTSQNLYLTDCAYHLTGFFYIRPSSVVVEAGHFSPTPLDSPIIRFPSQLTFSGTGPESASFTRSKDERHGKSTVTSTFPDAIDIVGYVAWLPMTGHTFLLPCSTVPTLPDYVSFRGLIRAPTYFDPHR
jgi:hypothetical protein